MHTSPFQMRYEKTDSALRVWPAGAFDNAAALQLHALLLEQYEGQHRVFIDTADLQDAEQQGAALFRERLSDSAIPCDHLVFKGEHGLALAPEGSKIVMRRTPEEHVCCGQCAECRCGHGRRQ